MKKRLFGTLLLAGLFIFANSVLASSVYQDNKTPATTVNPAPATTAGKVDRKADDKALRPETKPDNNTVKTAAGKAGTQTAKTAVKADKKDGATGTKPETAKTTTKPDAHSAKAATATKPGTTKPAAPGTSQTKSATPATSQPKPAAPTAPSTK